ncbi:MAG: ABC transporter ATP-binding protein [Planctomycetota bacterium]
MSIDTMSIKSTIEAKGLIKRYGDLVAVGGLDLHVERGTCLGLLGPNGAGKTTTIEILEGLTTPDEGEVTIFGLEWHNARRKLHERIGVQLQETRLSEKLTVVEVLRLFASFYQRSRTPEEVVDLVGLTEKRVVRYDKLSGGQKQRLALGCALVNEPDLLFLDEPTTGLDPHGRRRVWEIIDEFKRAGGTVVLTTHYMEEAERLADQLIILDHGKTIAEGSPRAIVDSLGARNIIEFTLAKIEGEQPSPDSERLGALPGVISVHGDSGVTTLGVKEVHTTLPALLELLGREKLALSDLRTHRSTLDDVFVSLTGRQLDDD